MVNAARWIVPAPAKDEIARLAQALDVRLPAARVLYSRGYTDPSEASRFLRPSLDDLCDPFLMTDMTRAVERLLAAVRNREKILLYGDYDVDGTASIVVLKKAIELAGGEATYHVPHRLRDGYGMRPEVIDRAASEGIRLIVSVDTGIRAEDVVARAEALGVDVIVTDHHLPEAELPRALAILNPNRRDCSYPEKNLCGAGVAFKLVQGLFSRLRWPPGRVQRLSESFLKLVAIATIADVVPLTGENRIIVRHGLEGLRNVRNPGLRALLEVAGFTAGACPSAGQIAFRVAPRMNAAGRMASADDAVRLFLTGDPEEARHIAGQLHALNQDRQQAESEIVQTILEECSRVPVTDSQMALVFAGREWHRGVVGIVASRLVERFHRPVIVLSEEENGEAQGSGRSVHPFHLLEALESMPDLFTRFGGHRQAAGLALPVSRIAEFRDRLNAYAAGCLKPDDLRPTVEVDAELSLSEITDASMAEVLNLAPFGFGNPAPLFAVRGLTVCGEPVILNGKHVRLNLRQNGRNLLLKAWNFAERATALRDGTTIDAVICVEDDFYASNRGLPGWCAVLKDVRLQTEHGA
ncbi:MAG: single-stranded-DNA-specific exonuclease RecJ [Bryobacterales bacterium]|nr:single-stranded-DNA-specific exonuclease RecJ [Bryobacterales bacterium]